MQMRRSFETQTRLTAGWSALAATLAVLVAIPGTSAADQQITSAGPLTLIGISSDLNCSVNHTGDSSGQFFADTACGTFAAVGGTLFGPAYVPGGGPLPRTNFTTVSQSAVTGSGTAGDPYRIVTAVDLGATGLRITESDSYVVGEESYRTDVSVANSGAVSQDVTLYRAADCYLQGSDSGFGSLDLTTGAVGCRSGMSDGMGGVIPGPRVEQWLPLSSGSHYFEGGYFEVWSQIGSQQALPDTCRCAEYIDNGAGISWNVTVPAGGSVTRSQVTTASPLGILPLSTSKTADVASVAPGSTDGYTIIVSNPNASEASLDSITDTLPAGFAYVAASTTGATTADPAIAGPLLTWAGPIVVPGASGQTPGTVSLHFHVTASSTPGTYFNNAGATSANFSVAPTGDTAPITVTSGSTLTTTTSSTSTTTSSIPAPPTTTSSTTVPPTTTSTTLPPPTTTTSLQPTTTTTLVIVLPPAACPDEDMADEVESEIDAQCDCVGAPNHGAYVRCAVHAAKSVSGVPRSCKKAVKSCAARSTCGKPGFVTCCRTTARGATKCSIKKSAALCKAPKGGQACVGQRPSCCDACTATGCAH